MKAPKKGRAINCLGSLGMIWSTRSEDEEEGLELISFTVTIKVVLVYCLAVMFGGRAAGKTVK
jgi:hypothetical protein